MFAEVVGNGPTARASARGASWSGTRRPIVGEPPVRTSGSPSSGRRPRTMVSPPGQQPAPSATAAGVTTAMSAACAGSAMSSAMPLSGGRRLIRYNRSMPPGVSSATAIP